jgi:hypothetical protein
LRLQFSDLVVFELLKKMIELKGTAIIDTIRAADRHLAELAPHKKIGFIALNAFLRTNAIESNFAKRIYENCSF